MAEARTYAEEHGAFDLVEASNGEVRRPDPTNMMIFIDIMVVRYFVYNTVSMTIRGDLGGWGDQCLNFKYSLSGIGAGIGAGLSKGICRIKGSDYNLFKQSDHASYRFISLPGPGVGNVAFWKGGGDEKTFYCNLGQVGTSGKGSFSGEDTFSPTACSVIPFRARYIE